MKRNGIKKAVGAAYERLTAHYDADYCYEEPSAEELARQREAVFRNAPFISILVPAYETDEVFLDALLDSAAAQTYENWELIIADASESGKVKRCVENRIKEFKAAGKIKYHKLLKNEGISGNSNQALRYAAGDYIGLLDHDDLLTPDALYEMASRICLLAEQGTEVKLLYSDEDKCDETGKRFFEQNRKSNFNFDLLLSNNYICHFLMIRADLMKEAGFRPLYDGAQDYDLILRVVGRIREDEISHVGKVLYHWRCHSASTAGNPVSKLYAYEAGKRAVQDFLDRKEIVCRVEDTEHVGFYRVVYETDVLTARQDIGMVGGSLIGRNHKIISGILLQNGACPFQDVPAFFTGPANVMSVCRNAFSLDARTVLLRKEDIALFEEIIKVPYLEDLHKRDYDYCSQLDERIWRQRSMELSARIRERGQRLLWDPQLKLKTEK